MAGESFGRLLRCSTFGESHGAAVGVVLEGVPANLALTAADIQLDLDRRRPGQSSVATTRQESDQVEILSGVFQDRTLGTPIAMLIRNQNQQSTAYDNIKTKFRPGHADYGYFAKHGIRDWRGGGRSSGRETAARVAAGAVAKQLLAQHGIKVIGFARAIADVTATRVDYSAIAANIVRCADPEVADAMIARIHAAKARGDSVGGIVELHLKGCPAGLGEPSFDKLEAMLAHAVLSVGAVKGVEFGVGFACSSMTGSEYNDPFCLENGRVRTTTNHAGGILGGISTGEDIVLRVAIRPTPSIAAVQPTVNVRLQPDSIATQGRHDPCIVPRAVPVLEAMAALTLADALLLQQAYSSYRPSNDQIASFMGL